MTLLSLAAARSIDTEFELSLATYMRDTILLCIRNAVLTNEVNTAASTVALERLMTNKCFLSVMRATLKCLVRHLQDKPFYFRLLTFLLST